MLGIDPNNFTSALFIGVGAMLVASFVLGAAIWAIFTAGTTFFKHNVPTDAEQSAFEKAFRAESAVPVKPIGVNMEPLLISAVGFVVFLAVGSLFLSQIPGPRQTPKEEAKPKVTYSDEPDEDEEEAIEAPKKRASKAAEETALPKKDLANVLAVWGDDDDEDED